MKMAPAGVRVIAAGGPDEDSASFLLADGRRRGDND